MRIVIALALMLFSAGCEVFMSKGMETEMAKGSPEKFHQYQPIDPLTAETVSIYDKTENQMKKVLWASLSDSNQVKYLLPLQSAEVFVSKIDAYGKVSYLTASVSGKKGIYVVIMDYMKYRVEDAIDQGTGDFLGSAKVGVGLRIKAVVETTEAGLTLGSLYAIGVEARRGTLRGGISVDVIGIDSPDVTNLIPLTSEIDQTSIQSALQALASIKTKISDDKTMLTPHVMAVKQAKDNTAERIKEQTTTARERGKESVIGYNNKKKAILDAVAPNGILNKETWETLVDKSDLSDDRKQFLKTWTDLQKVDAWLTNDAAAEGKTIASLYKQLMKSRN